MLIPHFPWYPSRVWHMLIDSDFNIKMFISSPLSRILLTNKEIIILIHATASMHLKNVVL